MIKIAAIYGSPREGNTVELLDQALSGIESVLPHAQIEKLYLHDFAIKPCRECYACEALDGLCIIKDDDFTHLQNLITAANAVVIAAPIFFYSVNAQTKVFIDRFQNLWVKKYRIDGYKFEEKPVTRKGLFISAGATRGKELFRGAELTMRYFFDTIDCELIDTILCRGLNEPKDVLGRDDYLEEAFAKGKSFGTLLK